MSKTLRRVKRLQIPQLWKAHVECHLLRICKHLIRLMSFLIHDIGTLMHWSVLFQITLLSPMSGPIASC